MLARQRLLQQATRSTRQLLAARCQAVSTQASSGAAAEQAAVSSASQKASWTALGMGFAAAGAAATLAHSPTANCAAASAPASTDSRRIDLSSAGMRPVPHEYKVVFVLGGPGSGKGTQCAKLVEEFGLEHLSAGDLLRAHCRSGTADGNMVAQMIKDGQIVPSHVTIGLLQAAMKASPKKAFLIDGFPRNDENRNAYEVQTASEPEFVLFFDCPEAVMERRLLGRNEGRTDDNIETIRKRFKVFLEHSMPVIRYYEAKGKVRRVHADRPADQVYQDVRRLFVDAKMSQK